MWKVSMATQRRRRNQTNCGITWCWKTTIASALTSTTLSAGTILDRWLGQISISKIKQNFILHRFQSATCLRFEYDLLAKFLIEKRGYDEAIKVQSFDKEVDFVCKVIQITDARFFGDMHGEQTQGLTLDIAGGNLLRRGKDGVILAASHGTRSNPIFDFSSFQ